MADNAPAHRERFFSVDANWLHMDAPCNHVTIVGLATYDRPIAYKRLRAVVADRLLRYERFKQRVRETRRPLGLPSWETDPDFNLDHHIVRAEVPEPGDWAALLRLVEATMQTPLDPCRPLWRMQLVEQFEHGSALIMALSHAVADGAAMMHVLETFTSDTAEASLKKLPRVRAPKREPPTRADDLARRLEQMEAALKLPGRVLDRSVDVLTNPLRATLRGAHAGLALGKLLFTPPDAPTILRGRCGPAKRAVASEPLPLAQVKALGQVYDAKINDLVINAIAGGLRRYLLANGQAVRGLNVRALVPVFLQPWESATDLRNGFGLVFLSLPVGVADPVKRLRVVKQRMDAIKSSPEAWVAYGIMAGMGHTPPAVERLIAGAFGVKGTAVITNVMGPKQVRYLAGAATERMLFWVPQPAGLALGLAVMSYKGELVVTLATDEGVIPDPENILAGFEAELRGMGPKEAGAGKRRKAKQT
jgi:WS/DGAT/MGAT family acyltransferase